MSLNSQLGMVWLPHWWAVLVSSDTPYFLNLYPDPRLPLIRWICATFLRSGATFSTQFLLNLREFRTLHRDFTSDLRVFVFFVMLPFADYSGIQNGIRRHFLNRFDHRKWSDNVRNAAAAYQVFLKDKNIFYQAPSFFRSASQIKSGRFHSTLDLARELCNFRLLYVLMKPSSKKDLDASFHTLMMNTSDLLPLCF